MPLASAVCASCLITSKPRPYFGRDVQSPALLVEHNSQQKGFHSVSHCELNAASDAVYGYKKPILTSIKAGFPTPTRTLVLF
jgi:hypothetical protein